MLRSTLLLRGAVAPLLAVVSSWAPVATARSTPQCMGASNPPLSRIVVPWQGQQRVTRTVDLPGGTEALLTVTESGVDVRVEARPDSPSGALVSDNPVRRQGSQRLLLPLSARRVSVNLIRKEGFRGRVTLEVVALDASTARAVCATALRQIAEGDAAFARAQFISLGISTAPSGTAQREYDVAARAYQRAVATAAPLGTGLVLAQAQLSAAAVFYQGLQNWADSLGAAQSASNTYTALDDGYGRDRARAMGAAAEMELALGIFESAPDDRSAEQRMNAMLTHAQHVFTEVAAHHARRRELYDQALALNNLGLAFHYRDAYDRAIQAYQRAYALYEQLDEQRRQAQTLQNLAVVQQEVAQFANARDSYARVLKLIDEAQDPKLFAEVLNNLALAEAESGEPDAALRHYSQALAIVTRIQSDREQARSLHGIGALYYGIGNRRQAMDYLERALALRSPTVDPVGRIESLRAAANALRDAGRWADAITRREEALRLAQTPMLRARILLEITRDEAGRGAPERALQRVEQALADHSGGDDFVYARALIERARLRVARRQLSAARSDTTEAIATFRRHQLSASTFGGLVLQARIACEEGDGPAARALSEEALALTEPLRRASANPSLRAALWQSLRPAFDFQISLVANRETCAGAAVGAPDDSALEALAVAEQARNRTLADYLRLAASADATPPAGTPEGKRRALFEQLANLRMQMEQLSQRSYPADPRMRALQEDLAALTRQIDLLDAEPRGAQRTARSGAQAKQQPPRTLREFSETISVNAAVVEYWLGDNVSYAWLITKERVQMVHLGPTTRIESAARHLHESLRNAGGVPLEERVRRSHELYALIIAPLPADVLARTRTIMFVPDGALHYIPFAVLASSGGETARYLIEDHDIAVSPSLHLATDRDDEIRPSAPGSVLIVADPVYSRADERFAATGAQRRPSAGADSASAALTLRGAPPSDPEWPRLPGSAREAKAIAALFPPRTVEMLMGFAATREALLQRNLSRYRVLHIAAHAVADVEAPQLSALMLSLVDTKGGGIPGEVFAGDFLNRRLNADLVVLSGCETSVGPEAAGEGLLGLRYAAHAGGARTVVASLWPVPDALGAQLISDFYSRLLTDRATPVTALSEAMRAARSKWRDPALWGVFDVSRIAREPALH